MNVYMWNQMSYYRLSYGEKHSSKVNYLSSSVLYGRLVIDSRNRDCGRKIRKESH
jgi:hypothetical protein